MADPIIVSHPPKEISVYCQWNGTAPEKCKSDGGTGYFTMYDGTVVREKDYEDCGYYKLIVTEPTMTEDQVKDEEVYNFSDNQINKTWTVRDLTSEEIDQKNARVMNISDYYIWKTLLKTGVITQAQAVQHLPAKLVDAYLARARLLGD